MLHEIPVEKFPALLGSEAEVNSLDIITQVLTSPRPGTNITPTENRMIFKVMDAIEAVGPLADKIYLDDAMWEFLKTRFATMVYGFPNRAFYIIEDAIRDAKAVDPNSLKLRPAVDLDREKTVVEAGGTGPQPTVRPAEEPKEPVADQPKAAPKAKVSAAKKKP